MSSYCICKFYCFFSQEALINAADLGRDYEHCVELQKKANDHESAVSIRTDICRINFEYISCFFETCPMCAVMKIMKKECIQC